MRIRPLLAAALLFLSLTATAADPLWSKLRYRPIGPYRAGRVTAVAGVNSQPNVYYFGATGGGVFKSTDGGKNWEPITDGQIATGTVGAIGVAESDPNVIYLGMGEVPIRGNVSHGDGMYKSTDAGKTWKRAGLENTRHIGRVRVHPRNPDIAWAAVLGHIFGPHDERGVYKTTDGGKTWKRTLFTNNMAGAVDLAVDPTNANILYAGMWAMKRTPYSLESGGPGSGLWKSTDAGDTWTDLSAAPGMPKAPLGKVGVTVSPVNPERVWAIVEAAEGGVFRSDDAGKNWTRVNSDRSLRQRAWYYSRIYADTQSADAVYVLNVGFHKSVDGGRTYNAIATPHGDNHDLWIASADAARMIEGNDGGANVTTDAGRTWTEQDQATAQFYRVALDNDFPYNIYGAQQDNSTVKIASRSNGAAITEREWHPVGGGESGWIAPHPNNSNIVFAGSYGGYLTRYDHRSGQSRNVNVWPDNPMGHGAEDLKYRFQWNFPILFSPHDANTLYAAANILFKTHDEGATWTAISPDLTRNDRSKMGSSGGPITKDNTSVEYYGTIFTVAESPLAKGLLWAGSDDGLVHVTRDAGAKWDNVTPKALPEWAQINSIEASPHDPATAYLAATRYKSDDFRPYLYKTSDYGKTWTEITAGIPADAFTRVIREDPNKRGLLFAGTETGMYVSFNDGAAWQKLQLNLPAVPITDLALHKGQRDLIVATQGRSFWILDDLNILEQMNDSIPNTAAHLFTPEDAFRTEGSGSPLPATATAGENPANGAVLHYWLKEKGKVEIEIAGPDGKLVRKFSSAAEPAAGTAPAGRRGGARSSPPPAEAGLNRFVWNLRHEDAKGFEGMILWAGYLSGPTAIPGVYTAKLTAAGQTLTQKFTVKKDPRVSVSDADLAQQLAFHLQIRDKLTDTNQSIEKIRQVKTQLSSLEGLWKDLPAAKDALAQSKSLREKLTKIEEELYQTQNRSNQDPLNYPIKLNNRLAALAGVVASADAAPTRQSRLVYEDLATAINAQLKLLGTALDTDLPALNKSARDAALPAVVAK
jgi:photosystem II stability/assembly factor-like uncharacterized protein